MLAHRLAATAVVFVAACELVGGIPNRVLDEGACVVGERRACYPGPTATRRVGVCADGEQRCLVAGWGPCEGAVEPGVEQCDDGDDHDCDGSPSCAGSPRWSRAFGDATQQLARDGALLHDGRFVVVGIFEGTLALDAHELQSQGFDDIFVAAFEPESGAVSWATSLGGSGSQEREFFDMAVTNDGDLLIAGTLYGAVTVGGMDLAAVQGDGLLVRMSPEGEVRWARLYGGLGLQRLRGVAFDPVSEDIFVAGSYNGSF
ncbi:MAG: hypothetical protein KC731_42955, partial [Myxococcales bacterium]|nr:hypothetical protein [Myxococcales bacterium]